jgi:hypothetical protein
MCQTPYYFSSYIGNVKLPLTHRYECQSSTIMNLPYSLNQTPGELREERVAGSACHYKTLQEQSVLLPILHLELHSIAILYQYKTTATRSK